MLVLDAVVSSELKKGLSPYSKAMKAVTFVKRKPNCMKELWLADKSEFVMHFNLYILGF